MPTLTDWAWATSMLVQAMRASVTINCRLIALVYVDGAWRIDFFFAEDATLDRRLATEIAADFAVYMEDIWNQLTPSAHAPISPIVIAGGGALPLSDYDQDARIVFMRHELRYEQ